MYDLQTQNITNWSWLRFLTKTWTWVMASSNLHLENSNVKSKINNHNIAGAEQHQKTLFAATHKCVRFHFDASWPLLANLQHQNFITCNGQKLRKLCYKMLVTKKDKAQNLLNEKVEKNFPDFYTKNPFSLENAKNCLLNKNWNECTSGLNSS